MISAPPPLKKINKINLSNCYVVIHCTMYVGIDCKSLCEMNARSKVHFAASGKAGIWHYSQVTFSVVATVGMLGGPAQRTNTFCPAL